MERRKRTERRRSSRADLTSRDERLLRMLNRFRLATTTDLATAVFPGVHRHTVARRLRRLFDRGYLDVRSPDRAADNWYCIGAVGRAWLAAAGIAPGAVPRGQFRHHLACVRTWLHIVDVVRAIPLLRLVRVAPHWELQATTGGAAIVPDLLCAFASPLNPSRPVRLAIEVDCGTESHGVLIRKWERYRDAVAGGELVLGVALLDAGTRRFERIVHVLEQETLPARVWSMANGPPLSLGHTLLDCCDRVLLRNSTPSRETHSGIVDSTHGKWGL